MGLSPVGALDFPTFTHVAHAAQGVVFHLGLAFDGDLFAFEHILPVDFAGVKLRLAATEAHGRELLDIVGELKESTAARKQIGSEIGSETVTDHGDILIFGHVIKLTNLVLREELGFIHQHTGEIWHASDAGLEIHGPIGQDIHLSAMAATGTDVIPAFGVDRRLHHDNVEPALFVVKCGLDERITLATVHRPVFEVYFRHDQTLG